MASRYLGRPRTQIRRKDRRLDAAEWQDRLLASAPVGHLAITWEGQPHLHSNLFWHDGAAVYLHTAGVGRLRAILDRGPQPACFTVTEMGRILPAGTPFDFSTEYASVVLYGTAEALADPAEKRRALEGLMTKYAPHLTAGVDYEPMSDADIAQTSALRLTIAERSGKHNVKPAEWDAYTYPRESFIDAERAAGRVTIKAKDLA
jgi:nitroimidazol reductase NimA-like FMN-containing flavoprotein (pyridoxamine 5'-phosphate oxidase superfamily)